VRLPAPAAEVVEAAAGRGVIAGVPYSRLAPADGLDDVLLLAATELITDADIETLSRTLSEVLS
jgi:glycine dehydrogenase subunit 1